VAVGVSRPAGSPATGLPDTECTISPLQALLHCLAPRWAHERLVPDAHIGAVHHNSRSCSLIPLLGWESSSSGPAATGANHGKVERFHKTLLDEWAYARPYRSNTERRQAFTEWLRFYNHRRPHASLDDLTPMAVLVNNVHGHTADMEWFAVKGSCGGPVVGRVGRMDEGRWAARGGVDARSD
jgi:hypothetical protein